MNLPLLQNYINGALVEAQTSQTREVIDPSTEEAVAVMPLSGPADVDQAMAAASEAFQSFRATTPGQRQKYLLDLADAVEANSDALVEAQHRNTGQLRPFIASEEVTVGADQLRFFAGAARLLEGIGAGEYAPGFTSYVRREPLGVVAQIAPWNYPLMMAIWKVAPALAAGDTIVLKPASTTPESTVLFAQIAGEILPKGVFNVLLGNAGMGEQMVSHPTPQMVSITGSVEAGRSVAHAAEGTLKRCHLELGGKAPFVVFADADLEAAADQAVGAGFFNAGQDCTAATRVLVEKSVYDQFVALLVQKAEATRTGNSDDPDTYYGPLNSANQLAHVTEFIEHLPSHATVATGGHRVGDKGYYFAPTVVTGVHQDDAIVQQEVFGPVITVQPFDTADEAIALANGVDFGLASSVWTSSNAIAMRFSRELDFGCVWVNTHIPLAAEFPHGGFKYSGYGKDLSHYAVEEYTRVKHIMTAI